MKTFPSFLRVNSAPPILHRRLFVCAIFLTVFVFKMAGQIPGTLSFTTGPDHASGYSRMDVVWSGFSVPNTPGASYSINFGVLVNNGSSGQCVETSLTQASKNAVLTTGSVTASSSSVTLLVSNAGALGLSGPITLFSIYYVGTPGTSVSFSWRTSPSNQIVNINNPVQV